MWPKCECVQVKKGTTAHFKLLCIYVKLIVGIPNANIKSILTFPQDTHLFESALTPASLLHLPQK